MPNVLRNSVPQECHGYKKMYVCCLNKTRRFLSYFYNDHYKYPYMVLEHTCNQPLIGVMIIIFLAVSYNGHRISQII